MFWLDALATIVCYALSCFAVLMLCSFVLLFLFVSICVFLSLLFHSCSFDSVHELLLLCCVLCLVIIVLFVDRLL